MASAEVITQLPVLPPRSVESNKGDFGRVLVVAGSRGMSGAAVLCGSAALRGGAGLVTVAVPEDILTIVATGNPCYLTAPFSNDQDGKLTNASAKVLKLAEANDVTAVGPGLGRGDPISKLIADLVGHIRSPLVLDADGLNALVNQTDSLKHHPGPIILTPHPGEFARLIGSDVSTVQARRQELAVDFAAKFQVILVLKGHGTIVTDGRQVYQNSTGNPGMATGGTGDVLTGLIAALLGQKLRPFAAAQLGVYLHGLAGDLAQEELGQVALIASDLLSFLPKAFISYCSAGKRKA
jgi:NAD(P)H-hydrate epimerase